jgi:hypothetical protein
LNIAVENPVASRQQARLYYRVLAWQKAKLWSDSAGTKKTLDRNVQDILPYIKVKRPSHIGRPPYHSTATNIRRYFKFSTAVELMY